MAETITEAYNSQDRFSDLLLRLNIPRGHINRLINANNEPLTVDEDSDLSKQAVPQKTALESLRVCLFCNLETDGVKKNLDHMRYRHNFTILDIECLVNLKGILAYIAERI